MSKLTRGPIKMKDSGSTIPVRAGDLPLMCKFQFDGKLGINYVMAFEDANAMYYYGPSVTPISKDKLLVVNETEYALAIAAKILEVLPDWVQYITKKNGLIHAESQFGYADIEVALDPWPAKKDFSWRVECTK